LKEVQERSLRQTERDVQGLPPELSRKHAADLGGDRIRIPVSDSQAVRGNCFPTVDQPETCRNDAEFAAQGVSSTSRFDEATSCVQFLGHDLVAGAA
jgi:hypothetical protein